MTESELGTSSEGTIDEGGFEAAEGFWQRNRPDVLRTDAQVRGSNSRGSGAGELARSLLWLHYHTIVGFQEGIRAAAHRAKELGATKDEMLELLALAFINSGPRGMRVAAIECESVVASLVAVAPSHRRFPQGWAPDPGRLQIRHRLREPRVERR